MNKLFPKHAVNTDFLIKDNQLTIAGMPLSRLSQRIGPQPFYVYSRDLINQRVSSLRQQLPEQIKLHYAIKANPMPALVQHMATIVDGFDTASVGEMKIALDTRMSATNISIAGPGKRPEELRQCIAAGITINIESANELLTVEKQCSRLGLSANIAVRINPSFELKTAGLKMGGGAKPFGIDEDQIPPVLNSIREMELNFSGFHIYSGSQNLKAESIIEAQKQTFQLAERMAKDSQLAIKKLNIGGGFGIPYFPGDKPLATDKIGESLAVSLAQFKKNNPQTEVIIELGRYLVGEAGIYVCQVIDKKVSCGKTFLIVNGGLHHHLAASGNFGQVIRKNYPVAIGNKLCADKKECVTIVGPLCTPLDILADNIELPIAEIDDFVVIFQSGAYGYTSSPHQFLNQPECQQVLL